MTAVRSRTAGGAKPAKSMPPPRLLPPLNERRAASQMASTVTGSLTAREPTRQES